MGDLIGAGPSLPYVERLKLLTGSGIALWDVLNSCYRPGSLDSAIDDSTAVTNDFETFFREYAEITHVFFNGRKASDLFAGRIMPTIDAEQALKTFVTLPSTSPAFAAMNYEEKLDHWSAVKIAVA